MWSECVWSKIEQRLENVMWCGEIGEVDDDFGVDREGLLCVKVRGYPAVF